MSFWIGLSKAIKDVDALKEQEALAEERKSVRDEAKAERAEERAYRDRMDAVRQSQWEVANARAEADAALNAEKWETTKAATGQSLLDKANNLGIRGTPPSSSSPSSGSVPTPQAMTDSVIQINGWLKTHLEDETIGQEDINYLKSIGTALTDPKDAHEYWGLIKGIQKTTGKMPTVAQLRGSILVTQAPGYADNKKKAVEVLATINSLDLSTPEGLSEATSLYNQLKKIDLNAATIDADLSGFMNEEDLSNLHIRQVDTLDTEIYTNWLSDPEVFELKNAKGPAADIIMAGYRRTYGPQALQGLAEAYPQQFSRYSDNPAFRTLTPTMTPEGGGLPEAEAKAKREAEAKADLTKDPDNKELHSLALQTLGADDYKRVLEEMNITSPLDVRLPSGGGEQTGDVGSGDSFLTPHRLTGPAATVEPLSDRELNKRAVTDFFKDQADGFGNKISQDITDLGEGSGKTLNRMGKAVAPLWEITGFASAALAAAADVSGNTGLGDFFNRIAEETREAGDSLKGGTFWKDVVSDVREGLPTKTVVDNVVAGLLNTGYEVGSEVVDGLTEAVDFVRESTPYKEANENAVSARSKSEDETDLVEALTDSRVDGQIREALKAEFEKKYGEGSVEAAFEMYRIRGPKG